MPGVMEGPRQPLINLDTGSHIRVCTRCGMRYDWRRSPSSSLKMTYCGSLCERADLGFTLEALLNSQLERETPVIRAVAEITGR